LEAANKAHIPAVSPIKTETPADVPPAPIITRSVSPVIINHNNNSSTSGALSKMRAPIASTAELLTGCDYDGLPLSGNSTPPGSSSLSEHLRAVYSQNPSHTPSIPVHTVG
jgi:hypothetical protein